MSPSDARRISSGVVFTAILLSAFVALWLASRSFSPQARLFPSILLPIATALCVAQLIVEIRRVLSASPAPDKRGLDVEADLDLTFGEAVRRSLPHVAWLLALYVAVWAVGAMISIPVFVAAYLAVMATVAWWRALLVGVGFVVFLLVVFDSMLHVTWPSGQWPALQDLLLEAYRSLA